MSNRFERLSIAMVYFAIHPASEEETGAASEVHERELLEPFDARVLYMYVESRSMYMYV